MNKIRILKNIILIILLSVGLSACHYLEYFQQSKENYLEGILNLYNYDLINNTKTLNYNGRLFWIILIIFVIGVWFIIYSFWMLVNGLIKDKQIFKINVVYSFLAFLTGISILSFDYLILNVFKEIFSEFSEKIIIINYDSTYIIINFKYFYITIYFIWIILAFIRMFSNSSQIKIFRYLSFRYKIDDNEMINNKIVKKDIKNNSSRVNKSTNNLRYEKVSANFNRVYWEPEFKGDIILEAFELEELIQKYKETSSFKSLIVYSYEKKINIFIADENFSISLYPSYVNNIEKSYFVISLLSEYSKKLFITSFYKFIYHVAASLENSLNIVYLRISTQILKFKELDKKILNLFSKHLIEFIQKLFNSLRQFEISNYENYSECYKFIEIGREFYKNLTWEISKVFENTYNEIIKLQDEMYTGEYCEDLIIHKNDKVKTALDFFGLEYNSTYNEFKARYREYVKMYHPDANHSYTDEFVRKTTLININKEILEDYYTK
ncbi:hypothetical protein SCORR_v1c05590 [Spiroplasma corruscae]|uniref:J domain-containing protein n=1 Tax=Spiroplasma corruscae TaxID=216934 RepID=A0A222EPQ0_9MOLU|nr:J domain-containing protein [Spiroplasma corruscae]ASP28331.1 hypothetical protein SCORR_v1c05590 [Spiroplasma corruscae]